MGLRRLLRAPTRWGRRFCFVLLACLSWPAFAQSCNPVTQTCGFWSAGVCWPTLADAAAGKCAHMPVTDAVAGAWVSPNLVGWHITRECSAHGTTMVRERINTSYSAAGVSGGAISNSSMAKEWYFTPPRCLVRTEATTQDAVDLSWKVVAAWAGVFFVLLARRAFY